MAAYSFAYNRHRKARGHEAAPDMAADEGTDLRGTLVLRCLTESSASQGTGRNRENKVRRRAHTQDKSPMAASTSLADHEPRSGVRDFVDRVLSGEQLAYLITLAAATAVILIVALLVYQLWTNSTLAIHKFGFSFLKGRNWDPNASDFGALPFVYGTCVTALVALLIAVPMGVGAAIFLADLAPPKLSNITTFLIELLAAVPSVIYGLLGIFVFIPVMRSWLVPAV